MIFPLSSRITLINEVIMKSNSQVLKITVTLLLLLKILTVFIKNIYIGNPKLTYFTLKAIFIFYESENFFIALMKRLL